MRENIKGFAPFMFDAKSLTSSRQDLPNRVFTASLKLSRFVLGADNRDFKTRVFRLLSWRWRWDTWSDCR